MKKRIIILLLVIAVPMVIFASFIDIKVGTTSCYPFDELISTGEFDAGELTFGPEVRLNVGVVEVGLKTKYFNNASTLLEIVPDVGFFLDLDLIHFGLGITTFSTSSFTINSTSPFITTSFETWKTNQLLAYRANVGFKLNHFNINVDFTLPTEFKLTDEDITTIIPENLSNGIFSVSFLYSLF